MPEQNLKNDVLIIGAGIVGIATAYQLMNLRPDLDVHVIEKEKAPALHQTGRNSGVIHSGVYYKPGSLKAKNCFQGREELLSFCDQELIPYKRKHKLIVATCKKEMPRLLELLKRGEATGIPNISLYSKDQVKELEPNVNAYSAISIPNCHIIDFQSVANSLAKWIVNKGASITFNEQILNIQEECIAISKNNTYRSKYLINCTGLFSDRLAKSHSNETKQRILPFRGEYYELTEEKQSVINSLIYPVPDPKFPFLGVHITPMMNGKVEAGPNAVLAMAREGYRKTDFNWKDVKEVLSFPGFWKMAIKHWKPGTYELIRSFSKKAFTKDLQRLVPCIKSKDLLPGASGIRAQVVTNSGSLMDDFSFVKKGNLLHVLNAPSPAATSSFSIGRTLANMLLESDQM